MQCDIAALEKTKNTNRSTCRGVSNPAASGESCFHIYYLSYIQVLAKKIKEEEICHVLQDQIGKYRED